MNRFLVILALITSSYCFAGPGHQVVFDPKTDMLSVKTELCLYGRGIQQALIETSYKNLSNYLTVEHRTIAIGLADKYNLKQKQREYIEYLLTLKLNKDSLNHTYSFVGNDTCTFAEAKFELANEVNLASLFSFPLPTHLHFVAPVGSFEKSLSEQLDNYQIEKRPELYAEHKQVIDHLVQQGQQVDYYQFDLLRYKNSLSKARNSVYVIAEAPYKKLLEQYLQSKSYSVKSSSEAAFWSISVTAEIEAQKYLSIALDIKNTDKFQTQLINNSRQLPPTTLGNSIMLEKFFNVHIELLKLTDQLRLEK